ncbi:hypothetical protein NPIL_635621, partial [Nephila pilipes]
KTAVIFMYSFAYDQIHFIQKFYEKPIRGRFQDENSYLPDGI